MEKELMEKLPNWWQSVDETYELILTNDLDSAFTTLLLSLLFGCKIKYFYDFNVIYYNKGNKDKNKVIGCDLAIENNMKTFCNHVTRVSPDDKVNPNSINLNNAKGINKYNYFSKYSMSTLLMVLSLYGLDKLILDGYDTLTETQIMILLSIDSAYLGYYLPRHYEAWGAYRNWLKSLGLYDIFKPVLDKYSKFEWSQFQAEYGLKRNIEMEGNKVVAKFDVEFLKKHFPMLQWELLNELTFDKYYTMQTLTEYNLDSKHDVKSRVFSFAQTRKNMSKMTILI